MREKYVELDGVVTVKITLNKKHYLYVPDHPAVGILAAAARDCVGTGQT